MTRVGHHRQSARRYAQSARQESRIGLRRYRRRPQEGAGSIAAQRRARFGRHHEAMARRGRRRLLWTVGAVVGLVAVLAVVGPFIYIHFIEGRAPAKLELPKKGQTSSTTTAALGANGGATSVLGVWNVGVGSLAGYRVNEVLIGQNSTAVGRTSKFGGR